MDEVKRKIPFRSRFGNVVSRNDLPSEPWGHETGRYGAEFREAAIALGARDLGYCLVTLEPGRRSCPFHFHHCEEEVFFVLEGRGRLRQGNNDGQEEIDLRPGDFVSFPAGTGIAHQFINDGDGPFVYLAMSNKARGDAVEYPDSDKILVRPARMMLRRNPKLEYLDGES